MSKTSSRDSVSFEKMRSIFFFGLIIILGLILLYIFRPFIYPIFWAAVIAIVFYPAYLFLLKYLKNPTLTALAAILLVLIVIFIPLTILSILLVNESIDLYQKVNQTGIFQNPEQVSSWLQSIPLLDTALEYVRNTWTDYVGSIAQWISSTLVASIKGVTANTLRFVVMTLVMFYSLYYFFKDGTRMLKRLMHLSPLGDQYEEMLFQKFKSTTRATLKGTIIIGVIQGVIGGILFLITGIEGALIWGVVMGFIAIIPALGPAIVLLPASIIMLATGNIWQAIVLIIGTVFVSTFDNLIRPPLIGKDIQMHPLIVFFATVGGLIIFGVSGFIIGPIIAAMFISVISIYDHYYRNELTNN